MHQATRRHAQSGKAASACTTAQSMAHHQQNIRPGRKVEHNAREYEQNKVMALHGAKRGRCGIKP
jgi:hypothetical protein